MDASNTEATTGEPGRKSLPDSGYCAGWCSELYKLPHVWTLVGTNLSF